VKIGRTGGRAVVDRVYKESIPALRKTLEKLRKEFSSLDSKTDWAQLRIDPLLRHAKLLEQRLEAQGNSRLRMGVRMFHSDLVYLGENVKGLQAVLQSEKKRRQRKIKRTGKRAE
jgi:hypothetical protein